MTVIKFEKDNKTYTLLSKTTKVTTPSIRIGNNYTPLFEGKPESEVIFGDTIYTLSPLKVGKYNAAYKERPACKPDILLAQYISNGPAGVYNYTLELLTRPKYLMFSALFDNTGSVLINNEIAFPNYILPGAEIMWGTHGQPAITTDQLKIFDTGIRRSNDLLLYEIDKLDPNKTNKINVTITLQNHSGPTSFIVVFYGAYQVQMC